MTYNDTGTMKTIRIGKKWRGRQVKPCLRLEGSILTGMPIGSSIVCELTPEGLLLRPITNQQSP